MEKIRRNALARTSNSKKLSDQEINRKLFYIYIYPFDKMIYSLCWNYTLDKSYVFDNYNYVLENFYRRIRTYNPELPIRTWIHVVAKRCVFSYEKRLKEKGVIFSNALVGKQVFEDEYDTINHMNEVNYDQFYSDEILNAFDLIGNKKRSALLLQEAGYSLKEIAEIEHNKGVLPSKCQDTIKSRIFSAKKQIKKYLINNECEEVTKYVK